MTELDCEKDNLPILLERAASKFPDKPAIIFNDQKITYSKLNDMAKEIASALLDEGVEKEDRVAIFMYNRPEWIAILFGIIKSGAIAVSINAYFTGREFSYIINDSKPVFLFTDKVKWKDVENGLNVIKDHPKIITVEKIDSFPSLEEFTRKEAKEVFPKLEADEVALLIYTSGTTGPPKGAMLTHRNYMCTYKLFHEWTDWNENDTWMIPVPLFHVHGLMPGLGLAVSHGASIVLLNRFIPDVAMNLIQKYKVSIFVGVPAMYIAFLHHPDFKKYDLSSIRAPISSAAPLPQAVLDLWKKKTGHEIMEGYGATEILLTLMNPPENLGVRKQGSVGIPAGGNLGYVKIRITDEDGNDVPKGEPGELWVKSPMVMKGYWNRPEETKHAFEDGWFKTGDIVVEDDDGYIYIVDRKKDIINVGGEKVYPREVEEVLFKHECVKEAGVIGVPDEYKGEVIKAYIVLKRDCDREVTEDEIISYARKYLAPFKTPKYIEFRDSLPKSPSGKVIRRVLREEEMKK